MNQYSPEILKALLESGWHEGRIVDTDSVKRFVVSEGFTWFTQVEEFLKEFLGLTFNYNGGNGIATDFRFDVVLSVESFDTSWILNHYSSRINKPTSFCPVGVLSGTHMQLFMDEEKCFYGGYDDILMFFGKGTVEFLRNLCSSEGGIQMD